MLALLSVGWSSHHCLLSWGYTAARCWLVQISWLSLLYHSVYLLNYAVNKSQHQQQRCDAHLRAKTDKMNRRWEKETARSVDWRVRKGCEKMMEALSVLAVWDRQAGNGATAALPINIHQQVPGESCRSFTPAERTHRSCWVWCRR